MNPQTPPAIHPAASGDGAGPFWSVMIPTYQPRREFLLAALESVLRQGLCPEEMEIVVIDDASPDGATEDWVREAAGERAGIVRMERNLGLSGIWNECIRRARGSWIHIFHQDDVVLPGFHAALRSGIEETPMVGAAYCRYAEIDGNGERGLMGPADRETPGIVEGLPRLLACDVHMACAAVVVRRTVYQELGGFRPELVHAMDWDMWMRIANRFPVHHEPSQLACWRRHPDATTSRQIRTGENVRDIGRAIRVWRTYFPADEGASVARISSAYWAGIALDLAEIFLRRGDFGVARNQWQAAISCDPSPRTLARALLTGARGCVRWVRWNGLGFLKTRVRNSDPVP